MMMNGNCNKGRGLAMAAMVLGMGLGSAMAQSGDMSSMSGTGKAKASTQDKLFLKNASDGSLFEIKTSELALKKSNSDDVKKYAQQMIDDHNKLMTQMQPVAAQAGVTPPTDLVSKMHKAEYKKLQGLSGDAFDQEYIKAQMTDHQKSDADFKMEASSGMLPDEKAAAAQGEPIVAQHLQMIQQIGQAHNVTMGSSSTM